MGTLNNVVLGTLHMYHNKLPKSDVLEILETNFEESEAFGALKALHEAAGLEAPQGRQTSPNRTAVQAYAMDLFDCLSKLVSDNKLPVIVVSSNELARVPLNKKRMDNTEVATVNCKLEALETMIKNVVNTVNKLSEKPSFAGTGAIPRNLVGGVKGRDEGAGRGAGGAGGAVGGQPNWPPLNSHGQGQGTGRQARDKSPSVKRTYNDVAKENLENVGGGDFQHQNRRRQPRKMNYGTNNVEIEGAEAAPIEIFVGNTNPRATDDIIKRVLLKCADNMPEKPKLEILEVKLLTNAERDPTPRFKSWMVKVPYSFKSLMENDSFYPNGWSHRRYFPKRQQQDRNMRRHLDPNDPVNMELATDTNTA